MSIKGITFFHLQGFLFLNGREKFHFHAHRSTFCFFIEPLLAITALRTRSLSGARRTASPPRTPFPSTQSPSQKSTRGPWRAMVRKRRIYIQSWSVNFKLLKNVEFNYLFFKFKIAYNSYFLFLFLISCFFPDTKYYWYIMHWNNFKRSILHINNYFNA